MFKYTPRQIFQKIMVIGCGGTGSRLVPMLTQFLRSITKEHTPTGWLENPTIYLVDDDTVETKNLLRQNFIEADVGKNKASVLAQRYGRAYGVNVVAVPKRIENNISFQNLMCETVDTDFRGENTMFILCVDSSEARRSILGLLRNIRSDVGNAPFVIDAGNENNFGQVKFFHMTTLFGNEGLVKSIKKLGIPAMLSDTREIPAIPYPVEFYQNLQDSPSQGSCADLDQTLAINAAMATTIMGVVQNFYYVKPFMFNEISISLDGAGYTTFNTIQDFTSKITQHHFAGSRMSAESVVYGFLSDAHEKNKRLAKKAAEAAAVAAAVVARAKKLEEDIALGKALLESGTPPEPFYFEGPEQAEETPRKEKVAAVPELQVAPAMPIPPLTRI